MAFVSPEKGPDVVDPRPALFAAPSLELADMFVSTLGKDLPQLAVRFGGVAVLEASLGEA